MNKNDINDALKNADSDRWLRAIDTVIETCVNNGECFSSGEIITALRNYDPTMRFSAARVGRYIRDRFDNSDMPLYQNNDGTSSPVEQVDCYTKGISSAPFNTMVYVYGPSYADCLSHDFEVDIPAPAASQKTSSYNPPVTPSNSMLSNAPTGLCASIHADNRCCIPRAAFEVLERETGVHCGDGSPVYVKVAGNKAYIQKNGKGQEYTISRGRVLFHHPYFVPGRKYTLDVDRNNAQLVVNF